MNNKGSIIFAVLLILILTALGAAVLLRSANESLAANRFANSSSALWVADGGIQEVLWQYNYNNCAGMVQTGTGTACTTCTCGGANASLSATLTGYGDYDVTLNTTTLIAQSAGSIPSRSAANLIQRRIQATVSKPQVFSNGIYAQGQVTMSNNALVDSYNSSNGPYGGANVLSNGNIGTNGTSAGIISIGSNTTIHGNASTGTNGTVTIGSNSSVTGTITNNNSVALPAVVVPASLTSLASGGTLSINGSGSLSAGNYKYTNINLSNSSTLTVNGNVSLYLTGSNALSTGNNTAITVANGGSLTVYVDGVLSTGNNVTINAVSQLPSQLQIYSTYTGANGVSFSNNGTAYAAIYAPQTDVTMSNNTGFYGAVVGNTVTLSNNDQIHYDQALASVANPFANAIATNWQEY